VVFVADSNRFEGTEVLAREVFGPAAIVADACIVSEEIYSVLDALGGQLTASIYTGPLDQEPGEIDLMIQDLSWQVGRIIFNGPPTGVRVATAMVHGGPFPATNRPEMTAVGPLAIERWCRRVCYQNAPEWALPAELRDENPLRIGRFEDGAWVASRSAAAP
jgi:NADP-dependent aldehyde dehydrogenase